MALPDDLLIQQVTVEPYLGRGPAGPMYGPPVTYRARVEERRQLVRSNTGAEVVSEATAYLNPGAAIPPESRVTLPSGRRPLVITVANQQGAAGSELDHLEVTLT